MALIAAPAAGSLAVVGVLWGVIRRLCWHEAAMPVAPPGTAGFVAITGLGFGFFRLRIIGSVFAGTPTCSDEGWDAAHARKRAAFFKHLGS